jgi:hypothetical protein
MLRLRRGGGAAVSTRASRLPALQRKCACGDAAGVSSECAECQGKSGGALQRLATDGTQPEIAPPIVHDVLRSPGHPLKPAARSRFEHRFGYDFSAVRIHTGDHAAESARAVNAAAYAAGNHVVFAAGRERTDAGDDHLLAHELVHVMQWGDQPIPAHLPVGSADGAAERQARTGEAGCATRTNSLQRALQICEEYRADETASATPGPGININVSRPGKRADVQAKLQVHGAAADAAQANTIQNTISSNWNGSFPDGYAIATNVDVGYRADTTNADDGATQIELVHSGEGDPSYTTRNWLFGSRHMSLNLDYGGNALTWTAAHEFGHLLGLKDHYSESFRSKVASLFGGPRKNEVEAGFEQNIMAVNNGTLESRNVQELIARYTGYTCIRGRTSPP